MGRRITPVRVGFIPHPGERGRATKNLPAVTVALLLVGVMAVGGCRKMAEGGNGDGKEKAEKAGKAGKPEVSPAKEPGLPVLFSFETDEAFKAWQVEKEEGVDKAVELSVVTKNATEGKRALKMLLKEHQWPGAYTEALAAMDWSPYKKLKIDVTVEEDAEFYIRIDDTDSTGYESQYQQSAPLDRGRHTVTVFVDDLAERINPKKIKRLCFFSVDVLADTVFYIDNIRLLVDEERKETRTTNRVAEAAKRPAGAPKYSDVCFSSRWRRPKSKDDPHDTFQAASAFHATRLVWVYNSDPEWIAECRKRGYFYVATFNSNLPDVPMDEHAGTYKHGRILDRNGKPVTAPWMKGWNRWWSCVNSPDFRKSFLAHARLYIEGKADAFQMDDPGCNHSAVKWGGCFCEHCKAKAAKQKVDLNNRKQMERFQKASVKEFYADMRREIDALAGRHVPFSCNNYGGNWGYFAHNLFEIGMAELVKGARPRDIYHKLLQTRRRGKAQIFTFVSESATNTRRVIATTYACGAHCIVPWDVYLKSTPTDSVRYFGKPEEYADLYGFVRANAKYFDGYEDAAVDGPKLKETRYGAVSPMKIEGNNVCAFARARPGEPDAPVVIHVVDWRKKPEPCVLKLRSVNFFGGKPFTARLLVPPPYDADTHTRAEKNKDFSPLSKTQEVEMATQGEYTSISLPAVSPWGILVLNRE